MALAPRIELRQSQSLVMTPQLMQALKLLRMSNLELDSHVSGELERNPLLERSTDGEGPEPGRPSESATSNDEWVDTGVGGDKSVADSLDADAGDMFPGDAPPPSASEGTLDAGRLAGDAWSGPGSNGRPGGELPDMEDTTAANITLCEHLNNQLPVASRDGVLRAVASALVASLDESGYLRDDMDGLADRLGVQRMVVEAALDVVQSLDPAGIGARSLPECLELQLRDKNRFDPAMRELVRNLELLARGELGKLRNLCGVSDEDFADMLDELRALDPKPGLAFGGAPVQTVIPDVLVRTRADGCWSVELNTDTLPRVLLDRTYFATASRTARRAEDKAFLTECLQTGSWLIKSLDQRANTILKVATEIVRQQDGFLTHGVSHLRPLTLRSVADMIGMHESTVSRVTANKYMATPRGIHELKYFFTASIASADGGDAHSAEAVRHRIRKLIDAEDPKRILSDDTLVKMLKEDGIGVARRTVAKYREAMKIPSSVQRRREKKSHPRAWSESG